MNKIMKSMILGLLVASFGIVGSLFAGDWETYETTGPTVYISSVGAANPQFDILSILVGSGTFAPGTDISNTYLVCVDTNMFARNNGINERLRVSSFSATALLTPPIMFKTTSSVVNGGDLNTYYDFSRSHWGGGVGGRTITNGLVCFPNGTNAETQKHYFSIEYGYVQRRQ